MIWTKRNRNPLLFVVAFMLVSLSSCWMYSFNQGGTFPEGVESINIGFFENRAQIVAPILSPTITDKLRDKFQSESKLDLSDNEASIMLNGQILDYSVAPVSSQDNSTATLNRLSVTVLAEVTSEVAEKYNFEQQFTKFLDFDASKNLSDVENDLIDEITDMLVQEIFNKIAQDW